MNILRTAMLLAFLTALFMAVGYAIGGGSGMVIAFAIAALMNFFSYWNSDKMVLRMHQAVEVGPENAPEFYEIVRRLAEANAMPMPKTYIINTEQPNAFATGRNPQNAAVAASKGLLETLSPEEVAGVMAHEMAHIANRDTLTMTITATLAGAISMLGNFAFFMGGSRQNNGVGIVGTLLAILVAPLAAMLVQMAISRTREYSADRMGAEICGHPRWLASALDKIARIANRIPNQLAEQNPATAHMFIINPLGQHARDSLFSTHPRTENRIAALLAMEVQPSRSGRVQVGREEDEILPLPDDAHDETDDSTPNPWSDDYKRSPAGSGVPEKRTRKERPKAVWGRRAAPGEPAGSNDPDETGTGRTSRRRGPWS